VLIPKRKERQEDGASGGKRGRELEKVNFPKRNSGNLTDTPYPKKFLDYQHPKKGKGSSSEARRRLCEKRGASLFDSSATGTEKK